MDIPGIWFPEIYKRLSQVMVSSQVPKLDSLDHNTFVHHFARRSVPFILRNSIKVLNKNDLLRVIETDWHDERIQVRSSSLITPDLYVHRKTEDTTWGSYFKNYRDTASAMYAANNPLPNRLHKVIGLEYPKYYPESFFNEPRMWLGPRGAVTPLHKDIPDNFAFNYFGKKKWILFSPLDFPYLYMNNPTPTEFPDLGVSEVDVRTPDFEKFPEFQKARPIEFTLDAGEMLYLPAGWGHYVENIEESLLINFWLKREKSPALLGNDK